MDSPASSIRAWAEQLHALEAGNKSASEADGRESVRVLEKLRVSLTRFVGADGFTALMRRSLGLARAEVSSLQSAIVTAEGRLEGAAGRVGDMKNDIEASIAITAHLLALLVTFVGEPLARRLVRDTWPDESRRTSTESEDLK